MVREYQLVNNLFCTAADKGFLEGGSGSGRLLQQHALLYHARQLLLALSCKIQWRHYTSVKQLIIHAKHRQFWELRISEITSASFSGIILVLQSPGLLDLFRCPCIICIIDISPGLLASFCCSWLVELTTTNHMECNNRSVFIVKHSCKQQQQK